MITINLQEFDNILDIFQPDYEISNSNVIHLYYSQEGELSKRDILRKFKKICNVNNINFIRPLNNLTNEWVTDLKEMRFFFDSLNNIEYLSSKFILEPEILYDKKYDESNDEENIIKTNIKFSFYRDEIEENKFKSSYNDVIPDDIKLSSQKFFKDFTPNQKTAFLMMKFEDSPIQSNIVTIVKDIFETYGVKVLRADDKWYSDDLFLNIKTYMHCCDFGIGLFERVKSEYFNPNVSLEIGYMIGQNKSILLLKDNTLNSLHSDLVSKLYYTFDYQDPRKQLEISIKKWLLDKEIL